MTASSESRYKAPPTAAFTPNFTFSLLRELTLAAASLLTKLTERSAAVPMKNQYSLR